MVDLEWQVKYNHIHQYKSQGIPPERTPVSDSKTAGNVHPLLQEAGSRLGPCGWETYVMGMKQTFLLLNF